MAGLLAGTALAAAAQSQIGLSGGSQGVTFAPTSSTSAQPPFGICNGSTCSMGGFGALTNSSGSPLGLGISNPAASNGSPAGAFAFQGGISGDIPGTLALTLDNANSYPQFSVSAAGANGTAVDASPYQ